MNYKAEADFKMVVLRCIDSGLDMLGPASKQVVYSYLAQNQLSKDGILEEPWKFTEALKILFGRGSEVVERTIVMEMKRTLGLTSTSGMLAEVLATVRLNNGTGPKHSETSLRTAKPRQRTGRKAT